MKIGDLVILKEDINRRSGILVSIKRLSGLKEKAYWVYWSDGRLLWSRKEKLGVLNESR